MLKYINWNERVKLIGGLADNLELVDIAKKHNVSLNAIHIQYSMGVKVESEHTNDKELVDEIVKDHLVENPRYYTILKKANL